MVFALAVTVAAYVALRNALRKVQEKQVPAKQPIRKDDDERG